MHHPSQFAQRALPVLLRLFSSLPLPVIHSIGRAGGRLLYALPGGYRRHVQRNAAQAGFNAPPLCAAGSSRNRRNDERTATGLVS